MRSKIRSTLFVLIQCFISAKECFRVEGPRPSLLLLFDFSLDSLDIST